MRWDTSHSELRSWVLGCRQQFWFSRFCQLSLDPQVSVDWLQLVQRSAVPHFFDIVLPCPDCSECLRSPCYLGQFCHMVLVRRNEMKSYSQNVMAQLSMSSSSLILRHHFFSRSSCAPYLTTSGMYACIHSILMFLVYVQTRMTRDAGVLAQITSCWKLWLACFKLPSDLGMTDVSRGAQFEREV